MKIEKKKEGRRKPSSQFRGVIKNGNTWRAIVKAAGFSLRFKTEMEAAAHYNIVAMSHWKSLSPNQINSFWAVRPNRGHIDSKEGRLRVVDIDKTRYAIVDEWNYVDLKDGDWYVDSKTGFFTVILKAEKVDGKWIFEKAIMHEHIFGNPCFHKNRNTFDNRMNNLTSDPNERSFPNKPTLPFVNHLNVNEPLTPAVLAFREELVVYLVWSRGKRNGEEVGQEPKDPRRKKPGWKEWFNEDGGTLPGEWEHLLE